MKPLLLPLCLLLLSACSSAPPRPAWKDLPRASAEDVQRGLWKDRVRLIQRTWNRKELEEFLDSIRVPSPQRLGMLDGGGTRDYPGPLVFYSIYSLDDDFSLYVVWEGAQSGKEIRSTEVLAFTDLRPRFSPDLFEALAAIHHAPSAERGLDFNPFRLLRAVNVLHALGKDKALKALAAYVQLARDLTPDEKRRYFVDEYRILPIVQLLFESPSGGFPDFGLGAGDLEAPEGKPWPLFPIVLVQDVPFMLVIGYRLAGRRVPAADRLRLDLGPLRAAPLAPRVTPLEAADELTQSEAWKALKLGPGNEGRKRWQIRAQSLWAVASAFSLRPEESSNDCCVDPTEKQWRATIERAKSSGLLWSPEIQDFILGR